MLVAWEIFYNGTSNPVPVGEEFDRVKGYMDFVEGQAQNSFVLTSVADGIPEFVELFDVVLTSADRGKFSVTHNLLHINFTDEIYF